MDITRSRALEYVARQKADGYQPSTINLDLQYLTTALRLAHEAGKVLAVPRFPRLKRTRREVTFQPHELEALLAAMPEWWRRFFRVTDEIGWRCRKELRSRQWHHVDFDRGWVVLDAGSSKTDKRRVFPITKHLRALLEDQRAWVSEIEQRTHQIVPRVFCTAEGDAVGDYRKVWASALKRAGFGKIEGRTGPWSSAKVAHDIRRTALTRWDDAELPRSASRGMAGHDSDQTFSGYAQATPQVLRHAAEKLDAYRERQAGESPKISPLKKSG
jgi:integrase